MFHIPAFPRLISLTRMVYGRFRFRSRKPRGASRRRGEGVSLTPRVALNPVKLLHADPATKRTASPAKPFSCFGEDSLKRTNDLMASTKRGTAMWEIIINLIYEQSCESYLAEAQSAEDKD